MTLHRYCDGRTRRDFLRAGALGTAGLTLGGYLRRLDAGDVEGARSAAERLIARDPLREEAHQVLIAVHGLAGTRSQVVRQYRRLCEVLVRELDEAPLPETDATYRIAIGRTVSRSRERAAALEPTMAASLAVVS